MALRPETRIWLEETGFCVQTEPVWAEALTHGSMRTGRDYNRLEFVGDRVLGLSVADWLYRHSNADEGKLAQRLNALVNKGACADVARNIGVSEHILLGRQAREDGAAQSDNVLGDVMESLLGANFMECGFECSQALVVRFWEKALDRTAGIGKHPKSALQEWAAGNRHRAPHYELVDKSGPDHRISFTVRVSVHDVGEADATASTKQEAETEAARQFMERFG